MNLHSHSTAGRRRRLGVALLAAIGCACMATGAGARHDDARVYRQILKLWAAGDHRLAVGGLVTLERQWANDPNKLLRIQTEELAPLVWRERRALVAVARLHQVAFEVHARGPDRDLVAHALAVSDRTVKLTLKYGKGAAEIRETAAVLQTSMALLLRNHRHLEASAQRLVRATELDPTLAVAFEWGGAIEEHQGNLGDAAKLLRRLVELEPDNFGGRLRLAMVEAKRGEDVTGSLEGIVGSDHRSWAWIFAVQELARDHASSGREKEAIDLLRRASAEYPRDQGLSVALAFLDRDHRGRSRATLEALETRDGRGSARLQYGGWQRQEAFAELVQATFVEHLPYLEKALGQTEGEGR